MAGEFEGKKEGSGLKKKFNQKITLRKKDSNDALKVFEGPYVETMKEAIAFLDGLAKAKQEITLCF